MDNEGLTIRVTALEKKQDKLESRIEQLEKLINELNTSLQVSLQKVQNIAEDLNQTSINFKEAMMRSNTSNAKETEALKEKCNELEKKCEDLYEKIEKETIVKDAEAWRNSKKQVTAYIIAGILGVVATALGLSHWF